MREPLGFRPLEIVVDGTDGAGKTPCVELFCERFRQRGVVVASHAPYREREVYPLWESAPERAARIIVEIMQRFRHAHSGAELFIWDRGWPTAYISTDDVRARALFRPLPTLTLLLLSTIARTRRQASKHPHAGVWATDEARVRRYSAAYHGLEAPNESDVLRVFPDASDMFDLPAIGEAVDAALPFEMRHRT